MAKRNKDGSWIGRPSKESKKFRDEWSGEAEKKRADAAIEAEKREKAITEQLKEQFQTKRNQLSKYIIQVKVKDVERLKYLEVLYNPHEKKVDTNFEWDSRDEEFNLLNEQVLAQKKIPNLFKLEISNQDDIPNINEFILQHQGFIDEIERLNLSEKEIVPINAANINELIRSFNNSNFTNLEYTRNVIWNSYNTFVSPFDRYHFHTFIAQVKVEGIDRLKYLEVFYNPVNDKITSDFKWSDDKNEYLRVN